MKLLNFGTGRGDLVDASTQTEYTDLADSEYHMHLQRYNPLMLHWYSVVLRPNSGRERRAAEGTGPHAGSM